MTALDAEKANQLHALADQFRGFAEQTTWKGYRARMLQTAEELDWEADQMEHPRIFARAS